MGRAFANTYGVWKPSSSLATPGRKRGASISERLRRMRRCLYTASMKRRVNERPELRHNRPAVPNSLTSKQQLDAKLNVPRLAR
jgi:hypothetical protein